MKNPAKTSSGVKAGSAKMQAAMGAYQKCLAAHGIKMPAFGGGHWGGANGGNGASPRPRPSMNPAMQAARAACASVRPAGMGPQGAHWNGLGNNGTGAPAPKASK